MGAKASFPEISAQEKPHNGGLKRAIVWRKVANIYAVKIHTGFIEVLRNTVHKFVNEVSELLPEITQDELAMLNASVDARRG